jgi:hypothetical protein
MLTRRSPQGLFKTMFATALVACLSFGSSSAVAAPQSISSEKELSAALKNVKTADEHRRIAAYYQQKSQKLQNKEKQEQELADYFAAHSSMYGKQYPTPLSKPQVARRQLPPRGERSTAEGRSTSRGR